MLAGEVQFLFDSLHSHVSANKGSFPFEISMTIYTVIAQIERFIEVSPFISLKSPNYPVILLIGRYDNL